MKLSTRPRAELLAWANARIPLLNGPFGDSTTPLGVENDDGLAAVVVFSDWAPQAGTIQASAAADDARWLMDQRVIDMIWAYAFETCGCQKVWAVTSLKNTRMLRCFKALGFEFEARLRRHFGDDDAIIARRFREDYDAQKGRISANAA